jgi:hypothetical protein
MVAGSAGGEQGLLEDGRDGWNRRDAGRWKGAPSSRHGWKTVESARRWQRLLRDSRGLGKVSGSSKRLKDLPEDGRGRWKMASTA